MSLRMVSSEENQNRRESKKIRLHIRWDMTDKKKNNNK